MNGQLAEHPLAELIREISGKNLSGGLLLEQQKSKVVVYMDNGRMIYAASNVRSLRLAEYLKQHEIVGAEHLRKFADKRSDLALAAALGASEVVQKEVLLGSLKNLMVDVLRLALLWHEGTWQFDERKRLDQPIELPVDIGLLALDWSRRIEDSTQSSRFDDPDEIISPGERISMDGLLPAEAFLLSRVDRPISIRELVAISGVSERETLRTVYGLTLAGFLQREKWPEAIARTTATKRPVVVEPPPVPQRSEEDEIKDYLERMEAAVSYYDVLGVASGTTPEDIKQVYYGLARKYHPDRFRGRVDAQLHARMESSFARITQSYETLMDANRRKGYDAKLAAREKASKFASALPKQSVPAPEKAQKPVSASTESEKKKTEDIFTEGFAALQQGQLNVALGLLGAAARALPQESRYRAYYGRALAANAKTRRSAESELQAALKIDPNNASYRVMLAELYRDLGFARRALSEAERALALEPGNQSARELVRTLK